MVSYAIVQASGKQFWVEEKRFYDFDKLPLNEGDTFQLNNVLLVNKNNNVSCLLYTSPSPRDLSTSRMPSSA